MSIPSSILMNLLSSGVRAINGASPPAEGATGVSDFSSMLGKARAGELSTGLPVTMQRGVELDLSDDQRSRLAQAADRAESAGARRALVLIDGRALELDVATRQIVREHAMGDCRVVTGIDGVIDLGGHAGTPGAEGETDNARDAEGSADAATARLDQSRWNRSLLDVLAER